MYKEIESTEFEALALEGVVVLDFFSTTCGPCKMLSFVLGDVEKALGDKVKLLKLDFNKNEELKAKYDVKGFPTLIFMKDGVEVKRMTGLQQKPAIIKQLEAML